MATVSKLPALPHGGQWHALLKPALREQLETGRPLLLSGRPLHGVRKSKEGSRAYCTARGTADVLELLQARPIQAEFCEVVPTGEDRAAFEALGHPKDLPAPRFFIDVDLGVPAYDEQCLEELPRVLQASEAVLRGLFPEAPPISLQPVIAQNHRKKNNGAYKFSWHIIFPRVTVPNLEAEGFWLAQQIVSKFLEGRDNDEHAIDMAVYSRHRPLRLVGSAKEAKGPPLKVDGVTLEEALPLTLLTMYNDPSEPEAPMLNVAPMTLCGVQRIRSRSIGSPLTVEGTEPSDFGELSTWCRRIQQFLDTHRAAKHLEWQGARVNQMSETQTHIFARVGFIEKGRKRMCVFGQQHNGNAGQRWVLRIDKIHNRLEAACFPNNRGLPCGLFMHAPGKTSLRFRAVPRNENRAVIFKIDKFV